MIDRRSFVQWAALGAATFALPEAISGCASEADASSDAPSLARALGSSSTPPRRVGSASGYTFEIHTEKNRVDFFGPDRGLTGRADRKLNGPVAVGVDASERVLVLDMGNAKVHAFDLGARPLGAFAPRLDLLSPRDLAIEARSGTVAIADSLNHRVVLVEASGRVRASVGGLGRGFGDLNGPASVAYAPDGSRFYVADSGNARVHVFDAGGRAIDLLGGRGKGEGRFVCPSCVRVDPRGYVHVADAIGGYVSVFDPGHRYVQRFRPLLRSGRQGSPRWISSSPDGSLEFSAIPGQPA